ncbi:hypothetical protein MKP08_04700 [Erythrobacter sp. LQ02-29]|uniref:hypothetical protein n=1 Tax=Erythrobacter sp. LQ02-29 TaxID=2920384 RepID=UPI001F4D71DB|nr:hypothetical protein [Erythrobacter sp. LQ02-29]MCP9222046.1 hypothetical protein [Erythrobacter sp. LQ02-29]
MKKLIATALAASAMAVVPAASAQDAPSKGEQKLAKMLEGRVAGEAEDCIFVSGTSPQMTIIDKTAIVYRQGSTIWVNRPEHPENLDDSDILVTERFGGNFCRLDHTYMIDRTGGFYSGPVFLGEFVPYRLPDKG